MFLPHLWNGIVEKKNYRSAALKTQTISICKFDQYKYCKLLVKHFVSDRFLLDKYLSKWCIAHVNAALLQTYISTLPLLTALSIMPIASSNNANCGYPDTTFNFVFTLFYCWTSNQSCNSAAASKPAISLPPLPFVHILELWKNLSRRLNCWQAIIQGREI